MNAFKKNLPVHSLKNSSVILLPDTEDSARPLVGFTPYKAQSKIFPYQVLYSRDSTELKNTFVLYLRPCFSSIIYENSSTWAANRTTNKPVIFYEMN